MKFIRQLLLDEQKKNKALALLCKIHRKLGSWPQRKELERDQDHPLKMLMILLLSEKKKKSAEGIHCSRGPVYCFLLPSNRPVFHQGSSDLH